MNTTQWYIPGPTQLLSLCILKRVESLLSVRYPAPVLRDIAQPAVLISQERFTTIAGWTFIAGPVPNGNGESEVLVYTAHGDDPLRLAMKNGLPFLSKELFWGDLHAFLRCFGTQGHPFYSVHCFFLGGECLTHVGCMLQRECC